MIHSLPDEAIARQQIAVGGEPRNPRGVVADYTFDNPFDVAFGTTRRIASRGGVSSATVVHTAQLLGYNGFKELRDATRKTFRV